MLWPLVGSTMAGKAEQTQATISYPGKSTLINCHSISREITSHQDYFHGQQMWFANSLTLSNPCNDIIWCHHGHGFSIKPMGIYIGR